MEENNKEVEKVEEKPAQKEGDSKEVSENKVESIEKILTGRISRRALRADAKLKENLVDGVVQVKVQNDDYTLDVSKNGIEKAKSDDAKCKIEINEENFRKVLSGKLNPQLAMLSDKIKVDGESKLAIYFFNLCVPQSRLR